MKTKTRRVLEVGYGGSPICTELKTFARDLPKGVEYHGIELARELVINGVNLGCSVYASKVSAAEAEYRKLKPENIFLYRMDGGRLAFCANSFHEVHMHRLVADHSVSPGDFARIMHEAKRTLKPDGSIIISDAILGSDLLRDILKVPASEIMARRVLDQHSFLRHAGDMGLANATVFHENIRATIKDGEPRKAFIIVARN